MRRLHMLHSPSVRTLAPVLAAAGTLLLAAGCHDGPMYAIKQVNPFFTSQWAAQEKLGTTDHKRAETLRQLVDDMPSMEASEQKRWVPHLQQLLEFDESPHMRALAVQAAARAEGTASLEVVRLGLDDDDSKVRMTAARALGERSEPEAMRMLVGTVNSEANKDVRLAAIKSLGNHQGVPVKDALKLALQEPDLAYRHASIASLRQITGQDAGDNAEAWIAMLEHGPSEGEVEESPSSWGARLKSFF